MNYRRGLFRLWLAASLCWWAYVAILVGAECGALNPSRSCPDFYYFKLTQYVLAPFGFLLLGFVLAWIIKGFQK